MTDTVNISFERDTLGGVMSKGQSSYFANSKMRDPNGYLLVFYHGDRHIDKTYFNCERGPVYFSEIKGYADEYAYDAANDIAGLTYAVYLHITNPLRSLTQECIDYLESMRIIGKNQFRVGDAISTFIVDEHDRKYRFYEWLKKNTNYDGIMVSEGLTPTHKGKYGEKADIAIIPFSSNQVKFTSNKKPTLSPYSDK